MKEIYKQSVDEVLKTLKTSKEGLTTKEVHLRAKEGTNEIKTKSRASLLEIILKQLKDKMIIILLIASLLSFLLGETLEGVVILIIIVINTIISVVEEDKALDAVEALKKMNAPYALVKRNGKMIKVLAKDLVVGDIVYLEDGSIVPADMRLLEEHNLSVNESALTGESETVKKNASIIKKDAIIAEQFNMVFSGTIVTYGTGVGVVSAIGMNTEVGKIANMLENTDELDTPLKRKLNAVGGTLSIVGVLISVLIFIIGLMHGQNFVTILMIAVSLAISVIPEGLPATATIVMALGVRRMASRNALVKELPAVETLGSASVICTDKTGTLTQNKMTVIDTLFYPELNGKSEVPLDFYYCSTLCNNAWIDSGDPTEIALLDYVYRRYDIGELKTKYPKIFEMPFDSKRKLMSTVHQIDNKYVCYTKGALESVLEVCTKIMSDGKIIPLTEEIKNEIMISTEKYLKEAKRLLAFAKKEIKTLPENEEENIEYDLTFIGITTMIDPPRVGVRKAIKSCHNAGIKVIMITGDHKTTATAIAKDLGIYRNGDRVLTGKELQKMDFNRLKRIINKVTVFARVSPEDKMTIIAALKENGEIVAMTGDGVNDAPALKKADIGISMGLNGTDVAKQSADMLLLDDNFKTIEHAVREGRRVYRNIGKVIQFLLAGNIAEVLAILVATVFNWQTPLLAIHILFVNLATDTLPALALGVDPEEENIMKKKPVKNGSLFEKGLVFRVLWYGAFIAFLSLVAHHIGIKDGYDVALTMTFLVLCFSQIIHALNQHSNTISNFSKKHPRNRYLYLAMLISTLFALIIYTLPVTRELFSLTLLSTKEWLIVILLSLSPLVMVEIFKLLRRNLK